LILSRFVLFFWGGGRRRSSGAIQGFRFRIMSGANKSNHATPHQNKRSNAR
jgi:hypothetical protein